MGVGNEREPEVYYNLTESIDIKNSSYGPKWTLFLVLCCLTACSSSFQFGYNIGSTNLPTKLIKIFYSETIQKEIQPARKMYENLVASRNINDALKTSGGENLNTSDLGTWFSTNLDKMNGLIRTNNSGIENIISFWKKELFPFEIAIENWWVITNCLFVIGGMFGAFTSKYVLDICGRKYGIIFHNVFTVIGSVLVLIATYIQSPVCVILSRLFFGIQGGMTCGLVPTYLTEISPSNLRGATGVLHQLCLTLGILVAQCLGCRQLLGRKETWHILLALPIIPSVVGCVCLLIFFPETPRSLLVEKKDENAARNALQKLRNTTNVSNEIDQMNQEAQSSTDSETISIISLLRMKHLRWPLVTGLVLQLAQQLCGINAIFFYSEGIFTRANIAADQIQYAVIATGLINVICTILVVPLIDRLGRKPLLIVPMIIMVIDFVVLTILLNMKERGAIYSYMSIVCIVIFIMSFAVGLGPIPFIYVAECFGQEARSAAFAVCMFTNWVANLVLTLAFEHLANILTDYVFLVFAVIVTVSVAVIFIKVPETKGRSVEEIMCDFGASDLSNRTGDMHLMAKTSL